jgi:hypothetical protein
MLMYVCTCLRCRGASGSKAAANGGGGEIARAPFLQKLKSRRGGAVRRSGPSGRRSFSLVLAKAVCFWGLAG